jgi:hypothetical protein
MKSVNYPASRKQNIVIQELNNEILIYDLEINKAFCLNHTSAMVWQECDGQKSVSEISQTLSRKLKSNVSEDFVLLALDQFKTDNLLENSHEFVSAFEGLSRREVIRRVGFATIVALPVISAVIAPSAVNAQSGVCACSSAVANSRPGGCACNSNAQCCSGVCGGGGATCTQTLVQAGPAPSCCPAFTCPPANGLGLAPGCGCNGNANCSSGSCVTNICTF